MLPQVPTIPADQRRLLRLYKQLDKHQKQNLCDFAEFLLQKSNDLIDENNEAKVNNEPLGLIRPEVETVVKAIKRLKENFFMLDPSDLLTETSSLMTAHIMQGRSAIEVIDDLEVLFAKHYTQHLKVET